MKPADDWCDLLSRSVDELLRRPPLRFSEIIPSLIPEAAGIYLITKVDGVDEVPYYIGRTKNLRQRIYNNHLMGPLSNARLKKYLLDNHECSDLLEAKSFIRSNCTVRWIEENDYRRRGAIEGYCTAVLFPKYGIDEEH